MSDDNTCPDCGKYIPDNSPLGLCPACCISGDEPALFLGAEAFEISDVELICELGRGAFGIVYEGLQCVGINRRVAVKVLHTDVMNTEVSNRFKQEIENLSHLECAYIARFYSSGHSGDGRPYYLMEYVDGIELSEWIPTACDSDKLEVLLQIIEAIAYAHQRGIAHRDIKPSNILVTTQESKWIVKLIDFGISRAFDSSTGWARESTVLGQRMGTPLYMSPEQLSGSPSVDLRSDVWSLGLLIYEMYLGSAVLQKVISPQLSWAENLKALETFTFPNLPDRELDWIARKSCMLDPDDRYQSISQLYEDIEAKSNGEAVSVGMSHRGYRLGKLLRRHKLAFAITMSGCAIVTTLAITGWFISIQEKEANKEIRAIANKETAAKLEAEQAQAQLLREASETSLQAAIRALYSQEYRLAQIHLNKALELWPENNIAEYVKSFVNATLPEAKLIKKTNIHHDLVKVVPMAGGFALELTNGTYIQIDQLGETHPIAKLPDEREAQSNNSIITPKSSKKGTLEIFNSELEMNVMTPLQYGSGNEKAYFNPTSFRILIVAPGGQCSLWDASEAQQSIAQTKLDSPATWAAFEPTGSTVWLIDSEHNLLKWNSRNKIETLMNASFLKSINNFWEVGEGTSKRLSDGTTGMKGMAQLKTMSNVLGDKFDIKSLVGAQRTHSSLAATKSGRVYYQRPKEFYSEIKGVTGTQKILTIEATAKIAACISDDNKVQLLDLEKLTVSKSWQIDEPVCSATIPDGGQHLVIATRDGNISVWDTAKGILLKTFSVFNSSAADRADIHIRNIPHKKEILVCKDGDIRLLKVSLQTGEIVGEALRHTKGVAWFVVSNDGKLVFSIDQNGKGKSHLRVWSLRLQQQIIPSIIHPSQLTWITNVDNGRGFLTCCDDGSVRKWDLLIRSIK